MKNLKKALIAGTCSVLLVAGSVAGTMAYLTSTDEVVNTFTVGNVAITLDEAPVDNDGQATSGDRVDKNNYKLMPGHDYDKDPTVHVGNLSEDAWLFVKVDNEIAAIEDATTVHNQMTTDNTWTVVDNTNHVYAYKEIVNANDNVVVFDGFKIKGDVDNASLATYNGKTIKVTAYAIQADGFDSASIAWTTAGSGLLTPPAGN